MCLGFVVVLCVVFFFLANPPPPPPQKKAEHTRGDCLGCKYRRCCVRTSLVAVSRATTKTYSLLGKYMSSLFKTSVFIYIRARIIVKKCSLLSLS